MVLNIKFYSSVVFFLWVLNCSAQNLVNVKHYSTVDGLSDNKITTAIKDRDGFMWFGSWAGISRFDGHNFVNFKSYPGDNSSLKSNRIDVIIEDKEAGFLWVKGYDNQVYRFDKKTGLFAALPALLQDESLKDALFTRIFVVANQQVWLLSSNMGVFLIQDALGKYPKYKRFNIHQPSHHYIPTNKISFFHTDKQKNVWLATAKGIYVLKKTNDCDYESHVVKSFGNSPVEQMDDGKNVIWCTQGTNLFSVSYNEREFHNYKITESPITAIKATKSGEKLYCVTAMGELISVTEDGKATLLGKTKDQSPLYTIFESSNGNLWIESERYGVVLFDVKKQEMTELFPPGKYQFNASTGANYSIYEDINQVVWIALDRFGLRYYDAKQEALQKISDKDQHGTRKLSDFIFRTFYYSPGVVWTVGDKGGLDKIVFRQYDFEQRSIKPNPVIMVDNEVRGIFADQQNRLWLGTKGKEVKVIKNNEVLNNLFDKPISFGSGVYTIFKDKEGAMWFGTKSSGLYKAVPLDTTEQKYKLANHYFTSNILKKGVGNSIYSVMQDSKGRIWAGSYGGGLILFQSRGGKTSILTLDNSFKNYPPGNFNRVRHLKEDGKGNIWVATTEGLLVFNPNFGSPANYQFKIYKKQPGNIHSLGGNDVQFLYKDSRNQMWVLTSSGGLNLAIGNNPLDSLIFQNFSTKDGLPSDFLLSCEEDEHKNLWIATQNGISKFSTINKKHQNFNYFDGLPEEATFSESSGVKMPDGTIVFGNTGGFLSFNPSSIHSKKTIANMVFTGIEVNGKDIREMNSEYLKKDISYANRLNLDYNQNIITINFAVLDFGSTDKQNYVCRIKGFDNVWRNTEGQRKITYTNLPPGNYTFQVKSLNDELYSPIPFRSIKITIHPPLWKTWWAYTLYVIIVVIVLVLIQRTIYTMLKLRHGIEMEKKMVELKLNFFTQISHELRTPLTLIVNPIGEVLQHEKLSAKGKKYAKLVLKNAKRMTRLVNQLLDLRKVQSGKATLKSQDIELISFSQNLISYFEDVIHKKDLKVQVISPYSTLNVHWDIEKMEIVIYNILSNAIKFSPNGGTVDITIEAFDDGKKCRIAIIDQGPGVLEDELQRIFNIYYEGEHKATVKSSGIGLALAKELVLLHNGNITAQNNTNGGLKIVFEIDRFLENLVDETPDAFKIAVEQNEDIILSEGSDFVIEESEDAQLPSVLIVEDNNELRGFLALKFSDSFVVETAENGEEGLEKAMEHNPDLILSDVMMPKMDGMEMLNKLKSNPLTSHIPVILLTAKSSTESHIMGLKYGADYYLPKPFDMKLLSVAMNSILMQRKRFFKAVVNGEAITNEENIAEDVLITPEDKEFLQKTIQVVRECLEDKDFNIDTVADLMNMSRSAFFKKFKSLTNLAPVEFVRDTRLEIGKDMLESGSKNVSEIAYAIGFNNPKYFSTCFKAKYGLSPKEFVNKKNS